MDILRALGCVAETLLSPVTCDCDWLATVLARGPVENFAIEDSSIPVVSRGFPNSRAERMMIRLGASGPALELELGGGFR